MTATPWTLPAPDPVDGPTAGAERALFAAYLDDQRTTLLNICAGLTGEQLARPAAAPSTLTLLGLLRHLRKVERIWFVERVDGQQLPPMFDAALGKDADFEDLDPSRAAQEVEALRQQWATSDAIAARTGLDDTFAVGDQRWSLRFLYLHLLHEYARHNGHADLVRQAIDGVTGR